MTRIFALAIAAGLAATTSLAAPVNLIRNGGFEDATRTAPATGLVNGNAYGAMPGASGLRSWDVFNSIPDWTSGANDAGIEVQTRKTLGSIDPHGGDYYVELDSDNDYPGGPAGSNSTMRQNVALEAGSYKLSFWYSPRDNVPGNNGIRVRVGVAGDVDQLFNGLVNLGSVAQNFVVDPSPTTVGTWSLVTGLFRVSTAGTYALRFTATGADNEYGGLVDDVTLAPVPLPAPAFLLIGAIAGLGVLRRRTAA